MATTTTASPEPNDAHVAEDDEAATVVAAFRELTGGAILHDLSDAARNTDDGKEVIVGTGADRVRLLNGIVTGNVAGTPVGGGCHATLLTIKAHVVAEMRIFVRAHDLYLVVPRGQGSATAATLERYAITDDFVPSAVTDFGLVAVLGAAAERHLAGIGYPVGRLAQSPPWSHEDRLGALGPVWMARVHQLGTDGYWVGAPLAVLDAVKSALATAGVGTLSARAAVAARVAAFEPTWGREITESHFPMEVGLGDTIDYQKGCFLGQEPIVRIRDRGHVNWRLAQMRVDWTGAPALDAHLESSAKSNAGNLTSVARVPGQGILALGLIHVSVGIGESLRLLGVDGTERGHAVVLRD